MFREMRRAKQAVPQERCREILTTATRGVLSVLGDDGYPYGVPVNFHYDSGSDTIYLHGAKEGHKIDAIRSCPKVCFTAWAEDGKREGDWAWYVTSVVAMGEAELVEDPALTEAMVRELGRKYYPDMESVEQEIRAAIRQVQLIAIHIRHLTGKQIHEK